jgi:hypothetical protein
MSPTSGGAAAWTSDIDRYYRDEIEPWLKAQEERRLAAVRRRWLIIGGGLAVAAIAVTVLLLNPGSNPLWYLLAAVIAGGALVFGIRTTSRLRREVKSFLAEKLAAHFGFTYEAVPTRDRVERFRVLGVVPGYDRCKLEDHWFGSADGVAFDLVEAHLEDRKTERDSKGHETTSYETVFRGLLLTLAYPHPFDGSVLLRRDLGRIVNWIREKFATREVITFEDPAFEDAFEVFADDAAEARRLLDPVLRQRILELAGEHRLMLAFDTGDVLLAIESQDLFEPSSLGQTLVDPQRVRDMAADLAIVFRIVDRLDLKGGTRA